MVPYADRVVIHDTTTTAVNLHALGADIIQALTKIGEELVVAALVGTHRDCTRILLNDRLHDLAHRTVVPEVDDLRAGFLQKPSDEVYRSIMPIEERRSGNNALGHSFDRALAGGTIARGLGLARPC